MRILTLCNLYPPQALGGYEMSCADVMGRFREAGHEVFVLTTDTRLAAAPSDGSTGQQVDRSLRWYWNDHRIRKPMAVRAWRLDRANRAVLEETVDRFRPDVASVWAMGGMSMSLLHHLADRRLPSVWSVCDEWPVYGPRVDAWAATRRTPVPDPGPATVCWVSEWLRQRVLERTDWRPRRELVTGSGIDERDFPVAATVPDRDRPWRWRLLAVGRVEPRKGFADAVKALARLPAEATLRIAGPDGGGYAGRLHELATGLGVADRLSVRPVPRGQLAEVYADADAVLFTSAWSEPFGLVPLEAMACGTPVIAMPTGGSAEFLDDGTNCLTVGVGDPAALAAACHRLAGDDALRRRLRTAGLETAAGRTIARLAELLEREHREVARAAAGPAGMPGVAR